MVPFSKDTEKLGVPSKGVWGVFKGSCAGGTSFRVINVRYGPLHEPGPRGVSTQGIQTYHCEANKAAGGWDFGIIAAEYVDAF